MSSFDGGERRKDGENKSQGGGDDETSWKTPLAQLREQQQLIRQPNLSDAGYIRQKEAGKLWVRERLNALLDRASFFELGSVTGRPVYDEKTGVLKTFIPANAVIGSGLLDGRKVFITADDFSVRGGHADGGIQMKAPYGEVMARKFRVPLIRLLDGSSGGGSVATYLTLGATYIPGIAGLGKSMDAMAVVPVASALLGPVVGLGAAKAVLSHFSVMVKELSQLFAAGPPVVKQATFEDLSKEALGGWHIHAQNGTVDNLATSELDAFRQIKAFLSYLPSSIFALPPARPCSDPTDRREEDLLTIIPRRRTQSYPIRKLVRLLVDLDDPHGLGSNSFFEIGNTWGQCIVTGFARLCGRPVGVLTSDCVFNGGAIDALGSQKAARFINLCDHFCVPILNLVDLPGFAVGSVAERAATIRHGATAMSALYNATIPIYTVVIRRSFGVAGGVFADPEEGLGTRVSWPSGDWGSLPLEGGVEAAYKRQLDAANSPEERDKMMTKLLEKFESVRSPIRTAHKFGVEEIIDPRDTRPLICDWVKHMYDHVLPQLSVVRQGKFGLDAKPSSGRGYRL